MSKPHYGANRDRWQLGMSWNDLASSGCLRTRGCSLSLADALPVLVGRAVGMLSPAGPGGWRRVREGVYQIHLFPAGWCSSSLLLFVASFCQDVPGAVRSLLLWEMDVTRSKGDSVFSLWVASWVRAGETVSLEHARDTMHGIMF